MPAACVYRFFDADGSLLYVGCTANLPNRISQHATDKYWWGEVASVTVAHFDTLDRALAVEGVALVAEEPRYALPNNSKEGWIHRRKLQDRAHLDGRQCQVASCYRCKTDRIIAQAGGRVAFDCMLIDCLVKAGPRWHPCVPMRRDYGMDVPSGTIDRWLSERGWLTRANRDALIRATGVAS